jgi:hypothetical protein
MIGFPLRTAVLAFAAVSAPGAIVPAFAAANTKSGGGPDTLVPVVIWSLVGICIGGLVYGVLYLFKKQLGGFPQPPSWTPPIDYMLSKDLPQDEPETGHHNGDDTHTAAAH